MSVTDSIFRKIYNTLDQIEVHGHKNIARMNAAMDALREVINIFDEAKKEEESNGNHNNKRENF